MVEALCATSYGARNRQQGHAIAMRFCTTVYAYMSSSREVHWGVLRLGVG